MIKFNIKIYFDNIIMKNYLLFLGVPYIEIKRCKKIQNEIQNINKNEEASFNFKNPEDKMNADTMIDLFKDWYRSDDQNEFVIIENWPFLRKYYYHNLESYK